ncbi:tryptophan synthase subunit alpha, partial [Streptomyces sp. NPDC051582]
VKLLLDAPDQAAGLTAVKALAGELAEGIRRG